MKFPRLDIFTDYVIIFIFNIYMKEKKNVKVMADFNLIRCFTKRKQHLLYLLIQLKSYKCEHLFLPHLEI